MRDDDGVLEVGQAAGAGGALAVGHELRLGRGAAVGHDCLEGGDDGLARLRRQGARLAGQCDQPVTKFLAVNDGIGGGNRFVHGVRE